MKSPRTIVVKTLFNADEFLSFDASCIDADVSHSKQLRDLAKGWMHSRNDRRSREGMERSYPVQNMALIMPGRANYGVRMRV